MAMSPEDLTFEIQRGFKLFKATTTMPDNSQLGWDSNPNDVVDLRTDGETLLFNSPLGTGYIESNGKSWQKYEDMPGGRWALRGAGENIDVPHNPYIEWVESNRHEDKFFHFEDFSLFVDDLGVPILFETILENEEDSLAFTDQYALLLEGSNILIDEKGEGLIMQTTDGPLGLWDRARRDLLEPDVLSGLIQDGYYSYPRLNGENDSQWEARVEGILKSTIDTNRGWVHLIGPEDKIVTTDKSSMIYIVQDDVTESFIVENYARESWDQSNAIFLFPNNYLMVVDISSRKYNIRPGAEQGSWSFHDLNAGGTYGFSVI